MIILIAISVGIREQNVLACLFMLMFTTMYLGLFTELYSRPVIIRDQTNYTTPIGRLGFFEKADYVRDPNALHLLSQSHWEGDRLLRDQDGKAVPNQSIEYIHAQRCSNYVRRMVPHVLGFFPFITCMVVISYHLEYSKWELRQNTNLEIPWFVNAVLYGSLILFSSFALVQEIFQFLPPSYYFGTEFAYCALSLISKLWLGILILWNVIATEQRAEDALGGAALEAASR